MIDCDRSCLWFLSKSRVVLIVRWSCCVFLESRSKTVLGEVHSSAWKGVLVGVTVVAGVSIENCLRFVEKDTIESPVFLKLVIVWSSCSRIDRSLLLKVLNNGILLLIW